MSLKCSIIQTALPTRFNHKTFDADDLNVCNPINIFQLTITNNSPTSNEILFPIIMLSHIWIPPSELFCQFYNWTRRLSWKFPRRRQHSHTMRGMRVLIVVVVVVFLACTPPKRWSVWWLMFFFFGFGESRPRGPVVLVCVCVAK